MKLKAILALPAIVLLFSSCIKEEAPSLEADIISITFEGYPELRASPIRGKHIIPMELFVDTIYDKLELTPIIEISPDAKIEPKSGVPQNFSDTVTYTVISESGNWQAQYKISIKRMAPMRYNFEDWGIAGGVNKYPVLNDAQWSSANQGIAIAKLGESNIVYPTQRTDDAYEGKYAAKLETQRGGTYWGNMIPIFAGSFFRGEFKININNFPKSPLFGQAHPKQRGRPIKFKGHYKYKPGEVYYNEENRVVEGKVDKFSAYSVLYKVTKGTIGVKGKDEFLDGTNILSSDKIIAKAEVTDKSAKSVYTGFDLDFIYSEEPDYNNYDYKLAIVFSSSEEGDFYRGAVGSCLIVDEVEVVCEAY